MESSSLSSIRSLVTIIKREIFSDENDLYSFVSKSAYDTAWLAMIPSPQETGTPMFKSCLEWVLNNQKEEGCWGALRGDGVPTIDTLPATLVCMVVLKKWQVGTKNIEKGMEFLHASMEVVLKEYSHGLPRWVVIVFPAAIELAKETGLELAFLNELKAIISPIYNTRQQILEREGLVEKCQYPPLLSLLESFPSTYDIDGEMILKNLNKDGSLFGSPSATAKAFMVTKNQKCLHYLKSLVGRCPDGVPPLYPMDEELIKLCMVDQFQKFGLFEYFSEDIGNILTQVHRSYMYNESQSKRADIVPAKRIYKDLIAFRLLRLHGYSVSAKTFCWFLHDEEIMNHLVQNYEQFTSLLYAMHRATDIIFSGEAELEETRLFSRTLLTKIMPLKNRCDNIVGFPNLLDEMIEQELNLPWIARLDHLDHRMWIEQNKEIPLWIEKASFYRLSCVHNEKLLQLAVENYKFRQFTYMNELEVLKRWTEKWGLSEMGFGREKTIYCYYAIAASTSLPHDSIVRMMVAKSAILVTVADDFYDMQGSLQELQLLTGAIQRWNCKGLSGPGKVIFDVLDDFVGEIAAKYLHQGGNDITENLRDIWRETFGSWLMEATWGMTGYAPSTEEYLQTSMTSIATHTLVLPSSCFLNPTIPSEKLLIKPPQYKNATKLLMATSRLLNDIQSYQREQEEGTVNLVLLNIKENPESTIEDSISYTKNLLVEKRKELLKHIMTDDYSDLPKSCKQLHLACLKVFQMFFHSSNRFDSNTELLEDIKKAIYIPPICLPPKVIKTQPLRLPTLVMKGSFKVNGGSSSEHKQLNGHRSVITQKWIPVNNSKYSHGKNLLAPKIKLSLI